MRRAVEAVVFVLALFKIVTTATDSSPPGKPTLTSCLSRDKETFTCWWDPSERGNGLRTTYALYYRKENSETVYQCPDYRTAGKNSCYFNKNNTSIWVNYNITVAATNAVGSSFSEPVVIDVAYIVQPHTPENVTLSTLEDKDGTFFRVSWEPPRKADTRSGWITLVYELRTKLDGAKWEEYYAGQQKMFNIFSLRSGGTYLIQVRCKPIHGFWSEWSPPVNITAPDVIPRERSMWLLIAIFSALIFLILSWILNVKSNSVKHCLFPPVPGPKIRGFDTQLLNNGRSDELFNALAALSFPARTHCDYEDLLVYIEVSRQEEQELMLADESAAPQGPKPQAAPSDSDSGHGSCDSHTLLMEKCGEGEDGKGEEKEEEQEEEEDRGMSEGQVKTWPKICLPESYNGSEVLDHRSAPEAAEQIHDSNCCFPLPSPPLPSTTSIFSDHQAGCSHSTCEKPQQAILHAQGQFSWQLCPRSEFHSLEPEHQNRQAGSTATMSTTTQPCPTPFQATEYVEVQNVIRENVMVLWPIPSAQGHREACLPQAGEEDYSRVKGLNSGNVLLLHRAMDAGTTQEDEGGEEKEEYQCDMKERKLFSMDGCCKAPPVVPSQPSACQPTAVSLPGDMFLAANGYVDRAGATIPTY